MHNSVRFALPVEDRLVSLVLSIIDFRLHRKRFDSGNRESEIDCANFLVKTDAVFESIWVDLPQDLHYRIRPFCRNAARICVGLGQTRNPDALLEDHLDRLQECVIVLAEVLAERVRSPLFQVA